MSKPQIHYYFNGSFCDVVTGCTTHFYSLFSLNELVRVGFWYDNMAFGLANKAQAKNYKRHTCSSDNSCVFGVTVLVFFSEHQLMMLIFLQNFTKISLILIKL